MLKQISLLVILGGVMWACDGVKPPEKPENLISKDKMADLLYELHIINAAKGVNRKILEDHHFDPEAYILEKYEIDSLQFAKSNMYYAYDAEAYKAIVEDAKTRLEAEKERLEKLIEKEEDSIKKSKAAKSATEKKAKPRPSNNLSGEAVFDK